MKNKVFAAEEFYQMVTACYFTGKCKSCPFWKLDKTSPTGRCLGRERVGTAFLDFLEPLIEMTKEKEQPRLFTEAEMPAADNEADANPMIPLEELGELIGERLWLYEDGVATLYRIVRMNTQNSEYIILSHCATDSTYYRPVSEYGERWGLYRECPQFEENAAGS